MELLTSQGFQNVVVSNNIPSMFEATRNSTKFYLEKVDTQKRDKNHFRQRMDILKGIRHKNILGVIDAVEGADICYIIYEYFDGKTLSKVDYSGYKESEMSNIAKNIMEGLVQLHNKNIVHTILDMDCILQTNKLDYKIFKLSYTSPIGDGMMTTIQSSIAIYPPEYEDKSKRGNATSKFDVWSLGLLMYKLWHRTDAFPTTRALSTYVSTSKLTPFEGSPNFQNFIKNCLHPNPESRSDVHQLLEHSFMTNNINNNNTRTETKGYSLKDDINDPEYIVGLISSFSEKKGKIINETTSYKKDRAPEINGLEKTIAELESKVSAEQNKINSIRHFHIPPEDVPMSGDESGYFNRITKSDIFVNCTATRATLNTAKRISLCVGRDGLEQYNWEIIGKGFQKIRQIVRQDRAPVVLTLSKDYIFDLDELDIFALPVIFETLNVGPETVNTIEFYSVLNDEQVGHILSILGPGHFFVKLKKERISFYSQLDVAGYKSANQDRCNATFEAL